MSENVTALNKKTGKSIKADKIDLVNKNKREIK